MFSYNEYKNIIKLVKSHLPIKDFADITEKTKKYCVVRHDIEFSLDRAYELARLEKNLGISSTYTVQLRNNTYNALSDKNIILIHEIKQLGHKIGLHICPLLFRSKDEVIQKILLEANTFEKYYGFKIDRFAFHRPNLNPELLAWYVQVDDLINCNGELFFHYFKKEKPKTLNVTYLSDSNNLWKFGHPLEVDFSKVQKLHVLMHPFSWTESGYQNYSNFVSLIRERNQELLHSMNSETSSFPQELLN